MVNLHSPLTTQIFSNAFDPAFLIDNETSDYGQTAMRRVYQLWRVTLPVLGIDFRSGTAYFIQTLTGVRHD